VHVPQDQHPQDDLGRPCLRLCGHRRSSATATVSTTGSASSSGSIGFDQAGESLSLSGNTFEQTAILLRRRTMRASFVHDHGRHGVAPAASGRNTALSLAPGNGACRINDLGADFFNGK
jgi:hypothetical protein